MTTELTILKIRINADILNRLSLLETLDETDNSFEIMFISNNTDWFLTLETFAK